jgi:hypothetical protein
MMEPDLIAESLFDEPDVVVAESESRGCGNIVGDGTPTAVCPVPCVDGATEGVTRKAAIGSLDSVGLPFARVIPLTSSGVRGASTDTRSEALLGQVERAATDCPWPSSAGCYPSGTATAGGRKSMIGMRRVISSRCSVVGRQLGRA